MFIVSLEYMKELAAVETYLAEHIAYLERYYQAGVFVMSGRKQPRRSARAGFLVVVGRNGRTCVAQYRRLSKCSGSRDHCANGTRSV